MGSTQNSPVSPSRRVGRREPRACPSVAVMAGGSQRPWSVLGANPQTKLYMSPGATAWSPGSLGGPPSPRHPPPPAWSNCVSHSKRSGRCGPGFLPNPKPSDLRSPAGRCLLPGLGAACPVRPAEQAGRHGSHGSCCRAPLGWGASSRWRGHGACTGPAQGWLLKHRMEGMWLGGLVK